MKALTIDDHWLARSGLSRLLKRIDRSVEVLEAENLQEGLVLTSEHADISLILLDLMMSGESALESIGEFRRIAPDATVMVVSMVETREDVLRAIDLGAAGYVPKTTSAEEMLRAIRIVLDGEIYFPRALLTQKSRPAPPVQVVGRTPRVDANALDNLTKRHRQVLDGLGLGKTNTQIAKDLGVSATTVRQHVSELLKRLGLSNRTQAAVFLSQVHAVQGRGVEVRRQGMADRDPPVSATG